MSDKAVTKGQSLHDSLYVYEAHRAAKVTKTERSVVPRGWGRGNGSECSVGPESQLRRMEKSRGGTVTTVTQRGECTWCPKPNAGSD